MAWLTAALGVAVTALSGTASAAPQWAPAATAAVHPGVQTYTNGGQCTANFVYSDGSHVYLGQAAHCASTGNSNQTNGCDTPSLPLGTPVTVTGASRPGKLVYSSWLTMQAQHEKNPDTCAYNDLALIQLDPADTGKVNPSIPFWGGPTALAAGAAKGGKVVSYGNSKLRAGISLLSPKQGQILDEQGGGWSHTVLTVTPGIPGDSGSAFLDSSGRALGILSTLNILPTTGSNGVGDVARELDYMHTHSQFRDVELVPGTEKFRGTINLP
ncbi:hypothetical protein GCM10025787_47450 [Saccharopolyspora rosea]|uniref:Trypsin-like peptidase domain-containing protein n=1 Tax=Saccharopolyspora rosea TaxID=524884 RepID=A0ABW3FW48_9PSEU